MLCPEVTDYFSGRVAQPFFYVVGDECYKSALQDLKCAGGAIVKLSDYCGRNGDRFPDIDDWYYNLRTADVNYNSNRIVVLGLGEYLALRGENFAERELLRLKDMTLGEARVVILLRGVLKQVENVIQNDHKIRGQKRLYIDQNAITKISIIKVPQYDEITRCVGIKHLLQKLESGRSGEIYVGTSLSLDDSLLCKKNVTDAFSLVKLILGNCCILTSELGSEKQYRFLADNLMHFEGNLRRVFEHYEIGDEVVDDLSKYVSEMSDRSWLVFVYLKWSVDSIRNEYLKLVVKNTNRFDEFKRNLLVEFTKYTRKDKQFKVFYQHRKKLFKGFSEADISIFVKENEVNPEESIYRLTDNTKLERQAVVKWIATYGWRNDASYVYPALDAYLKKYVFDERTCVLSKELTEYFEIYKEDKVLNRVSCALLDLVEKHADALTYIRLPTRDNVIRNIVNKKSTLLCWIDALGVEYLSYMEYLAKSRGLAIHIDIVRSDLPTITSINKTFYDEWSGPKIKDGSLDEIKHKEKGGYYFTKEEAPIHIPDELKVLDEAFDQAVIALNAKKCDSFVIASDHGASRLAVLHKQDVCYDTETVGEHSGRCCKWFDNCDILHKIEENGYIVLSDYSRFRGGRRANVEVHGGASLEEIVVPLITLRLNVTSQQRIEILQSNNIMVDRKEGVKIEIYISNMDYPQEVALVVNGKSYPGKPKDETHYVFALKDIKRAKKYSADVKDGPNIIRTIEFTVKSKTAIVNDDFDLDFEF